MTINQVLERVNAIRLDAFEDETKAQWLLELEGRLFRELVMRHRLTPGREKKGPVGVCPQCETVESLCWDAVMDANQCRACGWSELPSIPVAWPEDGDKELLVPAPYDRLYDLYVFAQMDFHNREIDNYNNSTLAFNSAVDAWEKHYHQNHMPIGAGGYANVL